MKKPSAISLCAYAFILQNIGLFTILISKNAIPNGFDIITYIVFSGSLCAYLLWHRAKTLKGVKALKDSPHPITVKELKESLKKTYSNLFTMFNHSPIEIVPSSLSDKLETSLFNQLVEKRIIPSGVESHFKTPDVRLALRTISSQKRLFFSLFGLFSINIPILLYIHNSYEYNNDWIKEVITYIITYSFLAGVYLLFFSDKILDFVSSTFKKIYFISILLILSSIAVCYYVYIFVSAYFETTYFSSHLLYSVRFASSFGFIFSAIGAFLLSKYLVRCVDARIALIKINASTDSQSLNALGAVDLILCCFQKNVENYDEDGWQ